MSILDKLEALDKAATPEPWEHGVHGWHDFVRLGMAYLLTAKGDEHNFKPSDAELIAVMRNALPKLIAVARVLEQLDAKNFHPVEYTELEVVDIQQQLSEFLQPAREALATLKGNEE